MSPAVSLADIRAAAARLQGAIHPTPTIRATALSRLCGAEIFLKLENLQVTGSFKPRGALNRLAGLTDAQRRIGVIAMSAGNHAQGVAFHCQRLGIPATIVMPKATPFTKIDRTARFGARVVLEGEDLKAAAGHARALERDEGLTFIHPYDDPLVIAGQGTIGLELVEAVPDLDAIVVPIGGGGLSAGIAVAVHALVPGIEIIGVQAALCPAMHARLRGAELPPAPAAATLAEGIAVKDPGTLTAAMLPDHLADLRLVSEAELERGVLTLLAEEKLLAEGAGAAALAAVLAAPERFAGRRVGLIVSGGNIDARLVASILMRGLVAEARIARLRVEISDQPGWLARVARVIGEAGGNIIEIHHQRLFPDVPVTRTDIDIAIETRDRRHLDEITAKLQAAGLAVRRLGFTALEGPAQP